MLLLRIFFVICVSCLSSIPSCLFLAALWSSAGKGLTSWFSCVMFSCVFVNFPCYVLDQVRYLSVSIPDLCLLLYFTRSLGKKLVKKRNSFAISGSCTLCQIHRIWRYFHSPLYISDNLIHHTMYMNQNLFLFTTISTYNLLHHTRN